MTTKENIIRQSIAKITNKISKIDFILNANPATEICKIRMEAQKLLDENKTIEQRTSNAFIKKIDSLAKREKEQFNLAEKGKNSSKLIDEKVKLEFELTDLNNELFYIERQKKR